MNTVDDLIALVRARLDARAQQLDEDERVALAATAGPWWHNPGKLWLGPEPFEAYDRSQGEEFVGYGESPFSGCIAATGPASHAQAMNDAGHIARWDPERVLAEVEAGRADIAAKRRIVDTLAEVLATASEHFTVESCDEVDAILAESVLRLLAESVGGEVGATDA